MSGYKDPDFQDRRALAQKARAKALEKLADAPKLDEATIAKRKAAQEAREAAIAEKSAAKRAAIAQAKAAPLPVIEIKPGVRVRIVGGTDDQRKAYRQYATLDADAPVLVIAVWDRTARGVARTSGNGPTPARASKNT